MDYLTLCQDAWRECGLSGEGPADVEKANSMHRRVCDWVNDAYLQICQTHRNWSFLLYQTSGDVLLTGKARYTSADLKLDNLNLLHHLRIKPATANSRSYTYLPYQNWVDDPHLYPRGVGKPNWVSFSSHESEAYPGGRWLFDTQPDQDYTLLARFWRDPAPLKDNFDEPLIPKAYRKSIVWKAKEFYAMYDESQADLSDAQKNFSQVHVRMESKFLPPMRWAENAFTGT